MDSNFELDLAELAAIVAKQVEELTLKPDWKPEPHQIPPPGDWYGWLLLAGRGAGKTDACSYFMKEHVKGPPCIAGDIPHFMGIVGPTLGDAATSCFSGPSGLRAHDPDCKLVTAPGGLLIRWPNGSEAKLFGARDPDDIERLRSGGNRCLVWCEELAAWRYMQDAFDQMRFGLRQGRHPRWIGSTTPKPRPLIKKLALGELKNVVLTHATMYDNPHLPQHIRDALEESYAGTALGAQELMGKLVEQDENALWTRDNIAANRIDPVDLPELYKITVGVDPSGGVGEQGIVIGGASRRQVVKDGKIDFVREGYTLGDYTCHLDPDGWGRRAVQALIDFDADDICVETNYGLKMATATILGAAEAMGISCSVREVHASRGKRPRAEPMAAMAKRNQWHHAGIFEELEDQLCTWTPEAGYSPDRLDADVWTAWHLRLVSTFAQGAGSFPGLSIARRKIG